MKYFDWEDDNLETQIRAIGYVKSKANVQKLYHLLETAYQQDQEKDDDDQSRTFHKLSGFLISMYVAPLIFIDKIFSDQASRPKEDQFSDAILQLCTPPAMSRRMKVTIEDDEKKQAEYMESSRARQLDYDHLTYLGENYQPPKKKKK